MGQKMARPVFLGSFGFSVGDLDIRMLKTTLKNETVMNNMLLEKLGIQRDSHLEANLNAVNEEAMVKVFNAIVDGDPITIDGKTYKEKSEIRALLRRIYPKETRMSQDSFSIL